jgi:hypothetical protein
MIVPSQILDIDWLRRMSLENNTPPYWFGLGFIQLKLTADTRIHFWLPWLRGTEREEIHNHRYNFTSCVLRGSLHKEIFSVTPFPSYSSASPKHELFITNCAPGTEGEETQVSPVRCQKIAEFDLFEGSIYWFGHDQFHTTEGTEFAVTYLERESKAKSDAKVVKLCGASTTCPFAKTLPVDEIWQHIEKALLL